MKRILLFCLILLFILCFRYAQAQDPQFSQFYAAQTYHNPAFAGSSFGGRASALYRNQWPAISGQFVTYTFAYDQDLPNQRSGVGVLFYNDRAGSANLNTFMMAGQYAYHLPINREWHIRAGLQMGIGSRNVDYSKFVFRDQLNTEGIDLGSSALDNVQIERAWYFDGGVGGLLYSRYFWTGLGAAHINEPNQSITGGGVSELPMRITLMAGGIIPLKKKFFRSRFDADDVNISLTPVMLYKRQGPFDQLDVGAYFTNKPFVVGMWYRGLPLIKDYDVGLYNHEAIVFLVGYRSATFTAGYSYDLTVSRLGPTTGGAHEISTQVEFKLPKKRKKNRKYRQPIPCPEF